MEVAGWFILLCMVLAPTPYSFGADGQQQRRAISDCNVHFTLPGGKPDSRLPIQGTVAANRMGTPIYFRTGKPKLVIPVGAGDLSAMVSFAEDELHLHLNKTDFLAFDCVGNLGLLSPGHIMVRFDRLALGENLTFDQCMNIEAG